MTDGARRLRGEALAQALRDARDATFAATLDLDDEQWRVPYHPGIQPTAWDLGHIAWFAEFWIQRGPHRIGVDHQVHADRPPRFLGPDAEYDSARLSHRARWEIRLHDRPELLARMADQLAACCESVRRLGDAAGDDDVYHARFALFHELMHVEALAWTRATLALPPPSGLAMAQTGPAHDVAIPGGRHRIGAPAGSGFAFDNELGGRTVELAGYAIDSTPVTNARFREFVHAGGYRDDALWPGPAAAWRLAHGREHPERWRPAARGDFEQRWFDRWLPLADDEPVVHVSAYEAEAFCRWAGRRLPGAAEWEVAAPRITWGRTVWEWTADAFAPYPGFRPGPYHTYSAPWFHAQREMRGGAFAASPVMHCRNYRNFFLPQRTDVFAGFRTVAS